MQEGFKPMASKLRGFGYRAEKPGAPTFVEQKWGYSGDRAGERAQAARSKASGGWAGGLESLCQKSRRVAARRPSAYHTTPPPAGNRLDAAVQECALAPPLAAQAIGWS
jgi:hypothetical protein